MVDLSKVTSIEDREWRSFCNDLAGDIAKRTCTEITNTTSNPVPVSVQFEGVGESGLITKNINVLANVIVTLVLEDKLSTLEIYSREAGVVKWNIDDSGLIVFNTIPCGCELSKSDLRLSGKTLYFKSNKVDAIEIRQWVSN